MALRRLKSDLSFTCQEKKKKITIEKLRAEEYIYRIPRITE